MNKIHKPGCLINVSCLAYHANGKCPGPYGTCTCNTLPDTFSNFSLPQNTERHGEDGRIEKEWEKKLDELWNEHDGTHFYKDEFKSFISQLLIDQKREWVKQEDISYKANSIHERQDFIEEVSEIINSINREGTLVVSHYIKEVIIKLLKNNMEIQEISDSDLLEKFKEVRMNQRTDGSFDVKLDEQNYIIGRDEIIRRWIYEQEA